MELLASGAMKYKWDGRIHGEKIVDGICIETNSDCPEINEEDVPDGYVFIKRSGDRNFYLSQVDVTTIAAIIKRDIRDISLLRQLIR